jgi:hypothetical protein
MRMHVTGILHIILQMTMEISRHMSYDAKDKGFYTVLIIYEKTTVCVLDR